MKTSKTRKVVKGWAVVFGDFGMWLPSGMYSEKKYHQARIFKTYKQAKTFYPGCNKDEIIQATISFSLPTTKKKK